MESIASLSLKADTTSLAAAGPVLDQISAKTLTAEQAAKKMAIAYNLLAAAGKDTSAIKTQEAVGNSMLAAERNTIRYYESWVKAANEAAAASAKAAQAATPQGIFKAAGVRSPEDTAKELNQLRQAKALWEEAGKGAEGYAGQIGHITARINTLTEGNARARGELRQMASAMASLAFEAAGAAFLVTAVVGAIAAPVLPGVGLMRTVEDTRLGMAAILVSMGRINGAAPSLPTALNISSGMMDKLVNDSMRFGVSIEALANTLRSTLAPGLAAGMSLKQIQEIATIGTIAVKTIGLDSKQTVQEIRDLVAGGIQAASSTLATSIGIKDSDIKRWREAGTLYEELMKKLQGFASASEESTKTLTGAWEVLKTKIALLMSDESGFGALKGILLGVSNYIGQIDEKSKKMVFNPALVESAKAYWELLKSIGAVLKQIGAIIEVLSPAIGGFAKAAAAEFGKVASILDGLIGKSATWESRMIAAARAVLNLSSLPGVAKAMSDVATPGAPRGPQSSGLITGLPEAGEVTGDLSAAGNKMRDDLLVGLKHTREGLQAEYEKIIQNTVSFERNLKMRRINLQIQSAEPRTGKAAEDYAVNYAAELSAIVAGEATLASAKTEARRSLNEKLASLDRKENKTSAAEAEIGHILKTTKGIDAQTQAVAKHNAAVQAGAAVVEAVTRSSKNAAEAEEKIAGWRAAHNGENIKALDAIRLRKAAAAKDDAVYALAQEEASKKQIDAFSKSTAALQVDADALAREAAALDAYGKGVRATALSAADAAIAIEKKTRAVSDSEVASRRAAAADVDLSNAWKNLATGANAAEADLAKVRAEGLDIYAQTEDQKIELKKSSLLKIAKLEMDAAQKAYDVKPAHTEAEKQAILAARADYDRTVVARSAEAEDAMANYRTKAQVASWTKTVNDIEDIAHKGFLSIGEKGVSAWGQMLNTFKKMFKTSVLEYIYKELAKPFVLNVTASLAGVAGASGMANAAGNAAGAASSGGGLLSMANTANSLYSASTGVIGNTVAGLASGATSLGGIAEATAVGIETAAAYGTAVGSAQTAMLAAQTGEMVGIGAAAAGEGIMAGVTAGLAAIPVWGWAALGALAIFSMDGGGGPKASELAITGTSDALRLSPTNVNDAGNSGDNAAYLDAAKRLNTLPEPIRKMLLGASISTGPTSDAAGLTGQLMASVKELVDLGEFANQLKPALVAMQKVVDDNVLVALAAQFKTLKIDAGALTSYYQNFYSAADKYDTGLKDVTLAMNKLGITDIPKTNAEFKKLVDAQDLTSTSGQIMFSALIGISGAFNEVTKNATAATAALDENSFATLVDFNRYKANGLTGPLAGSSSAAYYSKFADGGDHFGGLRMVGERGIELEATGPSRITNTENLMSALSNSGRNTEAIIAELRKLQASNAELRAELVEIRKSSKRTADITEKSDAIGPAPSRATL